MAVLGFNVGGYAHLTAAVLGLSAILATSAWAFTIVKWAGAAYLIYLGIATLRSSTGTFKFDADAKCRSGRTIFWQAFLSDVLNPKVAMFFLALLPQFVDAKAHHPTLQILLLGVTLNVIALAINTVLALCSATITQVLRENRSVSKSLHNAMGVIFIALGLRLAMEKA